MSASTTGVPVSGRDYRVDFFRGIALVMIFINHVPGNVFERFTNRNFGFSDAAEGFVFLAGFASAYAYGRPFLEGSALIASLKAWRRAGVLFLVHMTLTMATIGLFVWVAFNIGDGRLLQQIGLGHLLHRTLDTLLGLSTLGHQFGYVNILPMYIVLLLMVPGHLLILRHWGPKAMMAAAIVLWVAAGVFRLNMPNYPNPGGWFFNPIAWQVIFAAGLYVGHMKSRGEAAIPFRPWLYAAAILYLAYALFVTKNQLWHWQTGQPFHFIIKDIDKSFATLPRVLHLLALVYVLAYLNRFLPLRAVQRGNLMAMLGRHGLPVFATGTFLSLAAQAVRFEREPSLAFDTLLIGGGLLAQFALARYLDWWQVASKTPRKVPAAAPEPEPVGKGAAIG